MDSLGKPKEHHAHDDCSCCQSIPNPSVHQSLEEIDFERSIWQAAIDDDVDKINKFALTPSFDPNVVCKYGYTPLHYAARNGCLRAAKCLIKHGANYNAQTTHLLATALHRAVTGKKPDMVQFLLETGADRNIKDVDGLTAMDRAFKDSNENILKVFRKCS